MELQDFAPHLLVSQMRLGAPQPRFFDSGGNLIAELLSHLEVADWTYNQHTVDVFTADRREIFRVSAGEIYASIENFEEFEAALARMRGFFELALGHLGQPSITWMGVRTHDLAPVDSFDELRDALVAWTSPRTAGITELAGKQPTDVGWTLEYHGTDPRLTVRFGPMRALQAMETLFRDKDEGHYPPEFLMLDIDRFLADTTLEAGDVLNRWTDNVNRNRRVASGIASWFDGLK